MQNESFSGFSCVFFPWVGLSILIGLIGSARQISFWGAFFLSLFFSPIVGLIVTLLSKTEAEVQRQQELFDLQHQQKEALRSIQSNTANLIADELIKLRKLVDDGVISAEEFEIQKRKILRN